MSIAVLVLMLVAYGGVMIAYPEYRRVGLVLGAIVAVGLGLYFARSSPEATRAATRIDPSELALDQLALERTLRGAALSGRVRNGSPDWRLRDMTLTLRLRDCPEPETPPEDCPVIGEASAIARPDAPPEQIRGFSANFVFSNLPPLQGTLGWDWRITSIRATD